MSLRRANTKQHSPGPYREPGVVPACAAANVEDTLGDHVETHRSPTLRALVFELAAASALALFGLAVATMVNSMARWLGWIGAGLGGVLGVFFAIVWLAEGGVVVDVHEHGIRYRRWRQDRRIRWEDIDQFYFSIAPVQAIGATLGFHLGLRLTTMAGLDISLGHTVDRVWEIGQRILRIVSVPLIPRARAVFAAGDPLEFGPVGMDRDAVRRGRKSLRWSEVREVRISPMAVTIYREGKWWRWASIPVSQIPHPAVFIAIVEDAAKVVRVRA